MVQAFKDLIYKVFRLNDAGQAGIRVMIDGLDVDADGNVSYSGVIDESVETGIVAHIGKAQGGSPTTKSINYISTVASATDSVTAITASAGRGQEFINETATVAALFPFLGDDLGAGVNNSIPIGPYASLRIRAKDDTTWKVMS